ncbi:hypothetical protein [Enterovibrio sp. 27052020O]|uniref:hypothetical protein n=1 Tax=Enterovibrio sp. 27052020O TaxID=3241166 RepID=UPI00388F1FE9
MGRMFKALIIVPILVIRVPAYAEQFEVKNPPSSQSISYQQPQASQDTPLTELLSIPSFRSSEIKQPYSHLAELYEAAPKAQLELEDLAKTIAHKANGSVLSAGLKGQERAQEKVEKELNGDVTRLTDIVRITVETDSLEDLNSAYAQLAASTKTMEVVNRFQTPRPSGYRDVKVLVSLPESQMIAEVQLHLKAISAVKNGKEHTNYEQIQRIEREANLHDRAMSDYEVAKIEKLRRESRALYDNAWQRYLPLSFAV